jgi:hypothetical protein
MIPQEIVKLLLQFVPPPEEYLLTGQDDVPESFKTRYGELAPLRRVATEYAALHDTAAVLDLAREGKLAVGEKTSLPGASALRILPARMLLSDYYPEQTWMKGDDSIRPYGLIMAAQAGGLARAVGGRLQLTSAGEDFLREPAVARLREAWKLWLRSDTPDELRRIRNIKGQQSRNTELSPPSQRKACIAEALARCPAGQWISIEQFFQAVQAWNLSFRVEQSNYGSLYVGDPEYGVLATSSTPLPCSTGSIC